MCTYQHAFDGKGLMNVIYKVVEGQPPELPRNYSKELNDLLKKLVQFDVLFVFIFNTQKIMMLFKETLVELYKCMHLKINKSTHLN